MTHILGLQKTSNNVFQQLKSNMVCLKGNLLKQYTNLFIGWTNETINVQVFNFLRAGYPILQVFIVEEGNSEHANDCF